MVGKLVSFEMEKTVTQTMVCASNLMVENGEFSAAGVIENIAQTCAVRIGYINKYILKRGINLGFIGAIRNLKLHRLPRVGQTIQTTILTVEEVFGMTLVTATVCTDNEIIAEAEMKIAVSEREID